MIGATPELVADAVGRLLTAPPHRDTKWTSTSTSCAPMADHPRRVPSIYLVDKAQGGKVVLGLHSYCIALSRV